MRDPNFAKIDLQGKVALVTGASRGIGKAIAAAFAANGARVMLAARDKATLAEAAAEIGGSPEQVQFIATDVTDSGAIRAAVDVTVQAFGRFDIAVNNAGIQIPREPFADFDEARYDALMNTNLRSVFVAMKHELRAMRAAGHGGVIVNIGSALGLVALPGIAPYVAAKHGIIGLTKSVALECAAERIRVNAILPGTIMTDLFREGPGATPETLAGVMARVPMGRVGEPEDVAGAAVWLCSDAAAYVTGVALPVDGGFVL